jgi:hypothetical protein
MADLYTVTTGLNNSYATVGQNARKLVGDGADGIGPYTRFGTPQLQAIKVISASVDFSTDYDDPDSDFSKAVRALQDRAEIYYVGIPGNTATGFTVLINATKSDAGDGYGANSSADGTYDNLEEVVDVAVNGSDSGDITISNVTLTGLTFGA